MRSSSILFVLIIFFYSCNFNKDREAPKINWDTLNVEVSAYNSVQWQTGAGGANITAWGDTLKPGMKAIAVSRDLIPKGLEYNTKVKIEGFDSVFKVKDKMHYRWTNKIDIYMGQDVERAREFGRKRLEIYFAKSKDSISKINQ